MLLNYFVWIMALLLGLFIIILLLDINIAIRIIREGENDEINISFSILNNLLKYQIKVPFVDLFNGSNNILKTQIYSKAEVGKEHELGGPGAEKGFTITEIKIIIEKMEKAYRKYQKILNYIMGKITINNVAWETKIGLEDAGITAIFTGVLWGLKSTTMLFIRNKFNLNNVYLNVTPNYVSKKFDMTFHCIVTLKIGYIIYAGIKLLLTIIKGGEKYERASN